MAYAILGISGADTNRSNSPSRQIGATLLNTLLCNLNISDTSMRQSKTTTGPREPVELHDYEEIPDDIDLLTPKEERPIPAFTSHLARWIKLQRKKDVLPKKNLLPTFNLVGSKSPTKKPKSKTLLNSEKRLDDFQRNADYHYQRYKSFVQLLHAERLKMTMQCQPKPKVPARKVAPSGPIRYEIVRSGYYHPNALNKVNELHSARHLRHLQKSQNNTPWLNNNPPMVHPHIVRKTNYVWPKQNLIKNSWPQNPAATPFHAHQRVQQKIPATCYHLAELPRCRQPLSVEAAKHFIRQKTPGIVKTDSFVYNKF